MQAEIVNRTERVLRIQGTDSMGRTAKQRADMEANDPKPLKLNEATRAVHAICETEHSQYPKCMYRLALKDGKPAGDVASPDYPMPYDLAQQLGLTDMGFKVVGKNRDSAGNVVVRLPYITRLVGTVKDDLTIDIEAAQAEEAKLAKQGWVTAPHLIRGLPTPPAEQPFDALPPEDEGKPNGNGNKRG
jgi:hypothetical protein